MSRLKELVGQFCPDGAEYRAVQDCVRVLKTPRGITRDHYSDGTKYPIIDQGQCFIAGYTDDESLVLDFDECIVFGDHTREVKWIDFPFAVGADGVKVLRANDSILQRFFYYAFGALDIRSRGYNRHWTIAREMRIPIPPIAVQREIVSILDAMQGLDDKLGLEHKRRNEQLWQLRNQFYSDVRYDLKTLGSIGTFERGRRFTRAEMNGTGVGCIHYGDIYTVYKYYAETPLNRLDEGIDKKLRFATKNDVIIAATSENAEDVCTAIAWMGDEDVAIHDDCQRFSHDQNPLYMSMFFNSEPFMRQKQRFITESKVVRIAGAEMAQIEIPLPPRDIQDKLANAMLQCINLMESVELERSARQKQFEYYRDKLLDFPEKAV